MGVHGLWKLLEPTCKPVQLENLRGKTLAIDASIWVYHFLKAMRDSKGSVMYAAHIIGFFRRICKLLFFEIKPVFVFDGLPPILKKQTTERRSERRYGREQTARATANKLLTIQLERAAKQNADGGQASSGGHEFTVSGSLPRTKASNTEFIKQDQYHLPNLDAVGPNKPNDDRFLTNEEMEEYAQQFTSQAKLGFIDSNLVDFNSQEFEQLPIETKYQLLNMARLKSRLRMGYSADELNHMFPNEMDFSKFQINRVAQRNFFTQRLMNLVGLEDDLTRRVSSEKNKEYVLKNTGSGWTLNLEDTDGGDAKDGKAKNEVKDEIKDEQESGDEFEDVDISPTFDQPEHHYDKDEDAPDNASASAADNSVDDLFTDYQEDNQVNKLFGYEDTLSREGLYRSLGNYIEEDDEEVKPPPKGKSMLFDDDEDSEKEDKATDVPWFNQKTIPEEVQESSSDDELEDIDIEEEPVDADETKGHEDVAAQGPIQEPVQEPVQGNQPIVQSSGTLSPQEDNQVLDKQTQQDHTAQHEQEEPVEPLEPLEPVQEPEQPVIDLTPGVETTLEPAEPVQEPEHKLDTIVPSAQNSPVDTTTTSNIELESTQPFDDPPHPDSPSTEPTADKSEPVDLTEGDLERAEDEAKVDAEEAEDIAGMLIAEEEENARFAKQLAEQHNRSWTDNDNAEYNNQIDKLKKQFAKQTRDSDNVTQEMIQECQHLLQIFGIPYITAPAEAEAQCAELRTLKLVDGVVTDDGDTFLFDDRPVVYRNMFSQAKFVEQYTGTEIVQRLGLDRAKLIDLAFLLGSDYTEGVLGIGPVTGVEILAEFGSLSEFAKWWNNVQKFPDDAEVSSPLRKRILKQFKTKLFLPEGFPSKSVIEAYLHPAVDKDATKFTWGEINLEEMRKFMAQSAGWPADKTDSTLLPVIQESKRRDMHRKIERNFTQSSVTDYYAATVHNPMFQSKRANKATDKIVNSKKQKK